MFPVGALQMKVSVFLIHVVVEHVDGRSALAATLVYFTGLHEVGHFANFLTEIAFVQFLVMAQPYRSSC